MKYICLGQSRDPEPDPDQETTAESIPAKSMTAPDPDRAPHPTRDHLGPTRSHRVVVQALPAAAAPGRGPKKVAGPRATLPAAPPLLHHAKSPRKSPRSPRNNKHVPTTNILRHLIFLNIISQICTSI